VARVHHCEKLLQGRSTGGNSVGAASHRATRGSQACRCGSLTLRTEAAPRRPFQGWRYLDPAESPRDLPKGREKDDALPPSLAQALAPNIRVNAIGPGPALPSARMDQAEFDKQAKLTLLGRGTSPAEISGAVKFILSQPSLTGQMIALDGGQHLVWQTPDVVEVNE
jgi:hypothetical protein